MSESITTGDGCRLQYRFDGPEGPPILLLSNSLGTSMAMWEPQIAELSRSYRLLRYDSRGHGGSDAPTGAYSMDRLGRDVVELLCALGIDAVHFCGLSLGGMVGQWLGYREPARVKSLILANTSAYMGPPVNWDARIALVLAEGMAPLAEASITRWFTPEFPNANPGAIALIRDGLLATDPIGYAGCCAAIRDMDMRRVASLNTVPTLVIGGLKDPATPKADSDALAASLRSAQTAFLVAAHLSNVEQPRGFARLVTEFLETRR
jgi:3-oxoadipate enol-lactonase